MKNKIQKIVDAYKELNKLSEHMADIFGCSSTDGAFWDPVWKLLDVAIDQLSENIGDRSDWISWYIFDNQCGKKGLEVRLADGKKLKKIKTVDDLVKVIEFNK